MKDPFEHVDVEVRHSILTAVLLLAVMLLGAVMYPRIAVVVAVVLSLLVIICLHEFAHFITAKRAGMKVTEFFVGFGPRIWSITRGETEYGIKAIPLGGYCKIIGMTNLDDVPIEDEPRAYRSKNFRQKVTVAGAGSAMHFFIAFVLMLVLFAIAGDLPNSYQTSTVDTVNGPAAAAGIQEGDVIVAVDGQKVDRWDDIRDTLPSHPGDTVPFVVERDGQVMNIDVPLATGVLMLDAVATETDDGVQLVEVFPGGPLADCGREPGDVITEFAGEAVSTPAALVTLVSENAKGDVDVAVVRDGKAIDPLAVTVPPAPTQAELDKIGRPLAFGFAGLSATVHTPNLNVFQAGYRVPREIVRIGSTSIGALGHVFSPTGISEYINNLTGKEETTTRFTSPVGFAQLANNAVNAGWMYTLSLLISINVFIGLFNLVPLLPFDGGHIAIACYEKVMSSIRRRRVQVDVAKLLPLTAVVMAVLGFIALSSLFLDITNPAANPF